MDTRSLSLYLRLMRFDKPTGIWLLMFPCWWSVALASGGNPPPAMLLIFLVGAAVMRAAGCIINDIFDKNIDAQVARTRMRPLASGEVTLPEAWVLLGFLLVIALVIALMLGSEVVALSVLWLPLVMLYPLMKRLIWWPQLFLGITFNAGAIIGWVAVTGEIALPAVILYAGTVFWTLGYDTIYAHQDKDDDARIGVKSSARRLGRYSKPFVAACYAVWCVALAGVGILLDAEWPYFLLWLVVAAHLMWQIVRVNLDAPASCLRAFSSNTLTSAAIFALCVLT